MINTRWNSDDVAFVDFETTSLADLRRCGGRAYAAHPSTRVLCCGIKHRDRCWIWIPDWVPVTLPNAVEGFAITREPPRLDAVLCGHNALEFDAWIWKRFVGEATWCDTLPLCRAASLPASLDAACSTLFGLRKDPRGRILEVLCHATVRGGEVAYPIGTASAWHDLLAYCAGDVELLEKLYRAVIGYAEPDVLRVHQRVNDRGFPIDRVFAATLALSQERLAAEKREEIQSITEGDLAVDDIGKVQRVKRWLESKGVTLPTRNGRPSLDRRDLRRLLEDPGDFCGEGAEEVVAAVLRLRSEVARNTSAKALRMLETVDVDGRVRGQHTYHAAHTGRWGGRAVQPHNFPRGVDGVECEDPAATAAEAARLGCTEADVLATMLRQCISAPKLSVGDFGQVEARGICWMAGEQGALRFFADTSRDYYTHYVAPTIYGEGAEITAQRRWFAKQTGLGAGYGMSGRKMRAMLVADGVDFESSGVVPEEIIDGYRKAHPLVVASWKLLESAAMRAVRGEEVTACGVRFCLEDKNLVMHLPSSRRFVYRDAAIEMRAPAWAVALGKPVPPQPIIAYTHPRGWRGELYGGRLCLGADTKVLTRRGIVLITDIVDGDLVWDGDSWVKTTGCVCNGRKEVGEWLGVNITGDHLISDGQRWKCTMHLDERATLQCLEWAASSMPWSSKKRPSTLDRSTTCANAGVCAVQRFTRAPRCFDVRRESRDAQSAALRYVDNVAMPHVLDTHCSTIANSSIDGTVAGLTSSDAARSKPIKCTTTTVGAGSEYAKSGSMISRYSHSISSRCKDTMTYRCGSIGSITTVTTNQVTSGWSHHSAVHVTSAQPCGSNATVNACRSRTSMNDTGSHSVAAPYLHESKRVCDQKTSWKPTRHEMVYDLVNCGPKNRFTIITDRGPVIVHNCENVVQAEMRDVLADRLVAAEDAGLEPVLHVHDEIVTQEGSDEDLAVLMSKPPEWAPDFPLLVEVFASSAYRKKPKKGTRVIRAMKGVIA